MGSVSVCNYLYVHGGRFGSGECVVEVLIDGQVKKLALVRDGKGRSRIDRWESRPRSDGAVGEISIRDLTAMKTESGEATVDLWVDGVYMRSFLGRDISMGREGRTSVADLEHTLKMLDVDSRRKIAASQIKNASYGSGSADDTRERVLLALSHLTPDEVRVIRSGATDAFASLTQADLLRVLVYKCGAVGVKYSGEIEFDAARAYLARDSDLAKVSRSIDEASGVAASAVGLTPGMAAAIVEMYLSGDVDVSKCPDVGLSLTALRLLEDALAGEVPTWEEFAGLDEASLKALIYLHSGLRQAARSLSDDGLLVVAGNTKVREVAIESWREIRRRGMEQNVSYDNMLTMRKTIAYDDVSMLSIESAIKERESLMVSYGRQSEVLLSTPFAESAGNILREMEDRDLLEMMSSVSRRSSSLSSAASETAVKILKDRGSTQALNELLQTAVSGGDLLVGSLVMKELPSATVAEVAYNPLPVDSADRDSWLSKGVATLSNRLLLGEIDAADYESLVAEIAREAVTRGVKDTAVALAIPYRSAGTDAKKLMATAWEVVTHAVPDAVAALEVIKAVDAATYHSTDSMPELKPLMERWYPSAVKKQLALFAGTVEESLRLKAEQESNPSSYVHVPDAAYSDEARDLSILVKMTASAGVDMAPIHEELTGLQGAALEAIHRPRMEIAYGVRSRLQTQYRGGVTASTEAVRQSLEFLDRESTCAVTLGAAVTTVIQALNQESRASRGTDRGMEMFDSHRYGISNLRSIIESTDHFTGLEDAEREDLVALVREIEEEYPVETTTESHTTESYKAASRRRRRMFPGKKGD